MRNRASVVFSIQSWLGESKDGGSAASQPGIMSVGMSCKFLDRLI